MRAPSSRTLRHPHREPPPTADHSMLYESLILAGAVFVAGFTQGTVGFGFGMISMAVLPVCFSVRELVPVISLLGVVLSCSIYWRWRSGFEFTAVRPLMLGVAIGAPVGALFLSWVDRRIALVTLGVIIVAITLPNLLMREHEDEGRLRIIGNHGVVTGVISGLFGGAFNTGGPPLILYGSASHWSPASFRANLQVVFIFSSVLQLAVLARTGVMDRRTFELALIGLPAVLAGVALGTVCARRVSTERFRVLVWLLLLVLAANCMWQAIRS